MKIETTSANFSIDTLEALLHRLAPLTDGSFREYHIGKVMELARSIPVGEMRPISFMVTYGGEQSSFGMNIFMDDVDAPDVEFFSSPAFIDQLEREYEKLCDQLGI